MVGVAPGPPFSVSTFSGISLGLLSALRDTGRLVTAVDGTAGWLGRAELIASFHPDRRRWRARYHGGISPAGALVRDVRSDLARRRAEHAVEEHAANAILQLTGWFRPAVPGVLRCSYHDGNLATYLRRPDVDVGAGTAAVRRLMAWERRLYDETDVIFTMSEWLRSSFIEDFGQPPEKVVAVLAGANVVAAAEDVERDWTRPRFLFVGREFERKGGRELLAAWPAVRAARADAELVIVGPAAMTADLPAGVRFVGHLDRGTAAGRDALLAAYRDATAFVVPSLHEPFGIVFLEAMANGLPCLAADRCAMPEIVEDGITGRVVDPVAGEALEAALIELGDGATARRMGEAGRARMRERFTWAAVARRIVEVMRDAGDTWGRA